MKEQKPIGQNMLLFTSYWGNSDTFKLMPVTADCPYAEVIYDPATTLLVVISKITKENFQYVPKLDDCGDPIPAKKIRGGGKTYKENRVSMQILQEYYLINKEEQESFIKTFAINADTYNYNKYLRDMEKEPLIHQPEQAPLVDSAGMPLKVVKD